MSQEKESWLRFAVAVTFLGLTEVFLHSHSHTERFPPRVDLSAFPTKLGGWTGLDVPIPKDIRDILGAGEFMERLYRRARDEPYIDLFVAYFPTQRSGMTIHSPQNCLPGAGWVPVEASRVQLTGPDRKIVSVNKYIVAKGLEQQIVYYWYQSHGRVTASEYRAKILLVTDSIRINRSDGALVRMTTPIARGEESGRAQERLAAFAREARSVLDEYIPR